MKFIVLAKYTKQGTDGWLDNPDEDRHAMVRSISEKIEENYLIYLTRAEFMTQWQMLKHQVQIQ